MKKSNTANLDDIINEVYSESTTTNTTAEEINNTEISEENLNELNNIINQAIPIKTEIVTTNTSELNEIKTDFVNLITNKLDKSKDKDLRKYYAKVFKNIQDFLYYQEGIPKETSKGKGQKLAELLCMIVPWLQYLNEWDIVNKYLLENGISITTAIPLENQNSFEFLKSKEIKTQIKGFFKETAEVKNKIFENNNNIIEECYENLPENLRYDKDENPTGLKAAQFNKLVSVATKMQINKDDADEIQNKAVYQLECLEKSTNLLKNTIVENTNN